LFGPVSESIFCSDFRRVRWITPSRPLMTFAAIRGDHRRRDQRDSMLSEGQGGFTDVMKSAMARRTR
jgi:hypothetical protein